jgi:hypothetical protein
VVAIEEAQVDDRIDGSQSVFGGRERNREMPSEDLPRRPRRPASGLDAVPALLSLLAVGGTFAVVGFLDFATWFGHGILWGTRG